MTSILITGMSGTGKSTVLNILQQRGYSTVETDETGWCVPENGDWSSPDSDWIWDEQRIAQLLADHAKSHLVVSGSRPNQGKFYVRFDHVVLFTAPIAVMLDRVTNRRNNPFGKSTEEQNKIRQDTIEIEPLLRRGANLVIDTTASSPAEIADRLEALIL